MKSVVVKYKVKADKVADNIALVEQVFAELNNKRIAGVDYASYQLEDGLSFVHVVNMENPEGGNPLAQLSAFTAFTKDIADRCDEPPMVSVAQAIGRYRA